MRAKIVFFYVTYTLKKTLHSDVLEEQASLTSVFLHALKDHRDFLQILMSVKLLGDPRK